MPTEQVLRVANAIASARAARRGVASLGKVLDALPALLRDDAIAEAEAAIAAMESPTLLCPYCSQPIARVTYMSHIEACPAALTKPAIEQSPLHYPLSATDDYGKFLYCNCGHADDRCPDWPKYQEASRQRRQAVNDAH